MSHLIRKSTGLENSCAPELSLIHKLETLSRTCKDFFGALNVINLFTLKLHMLHNIEENLQRFVDGEYLDASSFEHFNNFIKSYVKIASLRKRITFEEQVQPMNSVRNLL